MASISPDSVFVDALGHSVCKAIASKHVPTSTLEDIRTLCPGASSFSLQVVLSPTVLLSVDLLTPGECSVDFITGSTSLPTTCIRNASLVSVARPNDRGQKYATCVPLFWHYNWRKLLSVITEADVTWLSVLEFLDAYKSAAAFPCLGCITIGWNQGNSCELKLLSKVIGLSVAVAASLLYEAQSFLEEMACSIGIFRPGYDQEYVPGEGFVTLSASDWEGSADEYEFEDTSVSEDDDPESTSSRSSGAPCKDDRRSRYDSDDEGRPSQALPSSSCGWDEEDHEPLDVNLLDKDSVSKLFEEACNNNKNCVDLGRSTDNPESESEKSLDEIFAVGGKSAEQLREDLLASQHKFLLYYSRQEWERVYAEHTSERALVTDRTCAVLGFLLALSSLLTWAFSWIMGSGLTTGLSWLSTLAGAVSIFVTRTTWYSKNREMVYTALFFLCWLLPYVLPDGVCVVSAWDIPISVFSNSICYFFATLISQMRFYKYAPLLLTLSTIHSFTLPSVCTLGIFSASPFLCQLLIWGQLMLCATLPCLGLTWLLEWRSRKQLLWLAAHLQRQNQTTQERLRD